VKSRLPRLAQTNQVIVQFADGSAIADRRAYVNALGGRLDRSLSRINTYVVAFDGLAPTVFPPSPVVVSVERDTYTGVSATNDTHYGDQWALPYLGVESIWTNLPEDVETITVAVVDSGVCLDHPDLAERVAGGWDFVEDDSEPDDAMGHGCGVAGVIAANPNNGVGVAGVAPIVEIMPLRVLDKKGIGSQSNIAAAIVYAADRKVDIINLSLASPVPAAAVEEAVNYALAKGVIVIAAAGNAGLEGAWYPAAYPGVVSVGAIDITEERSSFSNYGTNVDIYAPGRDIYTTSNDNEYTTMTGTSFAAPLVSGLTALDLAINGKPETDANTEIEAPSVDASC
jgi:thermitase